MFGTARVLDEHLLNEPVRFPGVVVVMPFGHVADRGELLNAELAACFTEGLEGVFRLTSHDDVADEPVEITLLRRVGKLLGDAERAAGGPLQRATNVLERSAHRAWGRSRDDPLEFLQHALMLAHPWNVVRA